MILNIIIAIFAVILFLYIFWKRLKDDYSSNIIFQTAFSILIGILIGKVVSGMLIPQAFFWVSFLGGLLGMTLMILKFKLRFYETFETLVMSSMPIIALMFFTDSIKHSSLTSFLAFVASLVLIFLSYWLDVNYKSFSWYKSGRIGFAGLTTAIVFFAARSVIAIFGITMISLLSRIETITSGAMALVCIVLLIVLGKSKE